MIKYKNITKKYNKTIIENLNLTIEENQVTAVIGPSGCGKTSLINILIGIDENYDGCVEGLENKKISVVFQEDRLIETETVLKNLLIVNNNKEFCKNVIDSFGLKEHINMYPKSLSGGMRRRLALSRGIIYNGDILVMDEPFKGIDPKLKNEIIKKIKVYLENKTCVFVTHDFEECETFSDRVVVLGGSPAKVVLDIDMKKEPKRFEELKNNLKMESDL